MMAGSAAEIKLLEYKDTIAQLNTLLTAQTELNRSLQKTVEDLRQDKTEKAQEKAEKKHRASEKHASSEKNAAEAAEEDE